MNSYHKEFLWTDAQVEAAKKVIKDEFPNAEIVVEYMDTKRIYDETYLNLLNRLYGLKYKNEKFDAIITTDDNALWFALDHREKLFKGSPISFCGINDYKKSIIEASSQVSGIIEVLDIKPTIDLALKIHPKTDRIVVIVDSTPTGIGQLREIKKVAKNYQNLVFEYLEGKDLSHEELFERLNSLSENSIVLLTVWLRDRNNSYLPSAEGGRLISKNSKAPVYGIIDMYFGDGIVGGKLLNSSTHGRIAAEKAIQFIQQKESPKAIQVTKSSMNPFMFDYEQLNRWNIDVSVLPQNSIIINEPFSFYKQYKRLVISTLLVIFILATIIVFLIINIFYRRKAESALKKSEEKYKLLADNANDVIWVRDMDLKQIYVSPSVEKVRGYTVEEAMKQELSEVLTPISAEKAVNLYLEMLDSGNDLKKIDNNISVELYHICKDGSEICMESNISLMRDNDSIPIGILGVSRDISDRKRTTEALRISEEKFSKAFSIAPVLMTISSVEDGRFIEVNEAFVRTTGYSQKFAIGKNSVEIGFISEKDRVLLAETLKEKGRISEREIELNASDGTKIYCQYSGELIEIDNSPKLLSVAIDITERKQAENMLRESEELLSRSQDIAHIGSWKLDLITNTLTWSDEVYRIFGYDLQEFAANYEAFLDAVHPDDRKMVNYAYSNSIQEGRDEYEIQHRIVRPKTGEIRNVLERCIHERDEAGTIVRSVGMIQDITEGKQAEVEQERLQAQLNQAQKMESVGRLAGGVAHDFNNMLGVILGHTELALLQTDEDHDLYSDLKEIQKAAQRSADITKQLLAFARKEIISPKQLDLNDTVESMLNMLRRIIGEDIDFVWQPAAHLWPVKMDPSQIDQILANLCINARDAISGVGKLTIETGRKTFDEEYCSEHPGFIPGDFVLLAVSDNGCGMDKEILDNLFEPFFTTKEVGKGTGLGLATIYGIVKQNNGFINVYSEPGQGSTFKIYLPRLVADRDTDKAMPQKRAAAGGTETILLVEDELSILRMTRMMLERKGYTVLSAAIPAEALEKANNHSGSIDLLMTDVVMPEMNGRDLAGQITDLYPDIRLLFMSGYTADVIAHQGILDDGVTFIQKPFSMADMTEKVREVLDMASDEN